MAKHLMTSKEAQAFIWKAKGADCFIMANVVLPTVENDNPTGKHFTGLTCVKVGRVAAMGYVEDLLKNFSKRGARIILNVSEKHIFIGGYASTGEENG